MHEPRWVKFLLRSFLNTIPTSVKPSVNRHMVISSGFSFLTEGARAEEKGKLVGRASVRALLPDPHATPCTPRMKPNAAAREKKNGTVAA
jgi:hypothetical protein